MKASVTPQLTVRRLSRKGSPHTLGARTIDLYVLVDPQAPDEFVALVGAAEGVSGEGPPSFREPGSVALRLQDSLLLLRVL